MAEDAHCRKYSWAGEQVYRPTQPPSGPMFTQTETSPPPEKALWDRDGDGPALADTDTPTEVAVDTAPPAEAPTPAEAPALVGTPGGTGPEPEPGDDTTRARDGLPEAPGPEAPAFGPLTIGMLPEPVTPGRPIIRTDTEASTNSTMRQPIAAVGRMLPAGCSRITAAVFRNATRTRSATRAIASWETGSRGPHLRRAS